MERVVKKCLELVSRFPGYQECDILVMNTMVRLLLKRGELDIAH